ncbi:MAG: hypothetical protein KDA61_15805, partial [Planctomycetales bacterium]|nr:hypothetical protein [Planctomycetales bacterium]
MSHATPNALPRPNWGGDAVPWTYVRRQIDTWLRYLPVDSFRLVCFNHDVHDFPDDEVWLQGE